MNSSLLQTVKSFRMQNVVLDRDCGKQHTCPCCGSCISTWANFGVRAAKCPVCKTLERHRTVCFDFITDTPKQLLAPGAAVAYFGPHENHAKALMRALPPMHLLEFDFFYPGYHYSRTTVKADLQAIPLQANTLDGVIVLHVLEHVPVLVRAVRELSRVVIAGGFVQQETPCYDDKDGVRGVNKLTWNGVVEDCAASRRNGTRRNGGVGAICRQKDHLHGFSCAYLRSVFEDHDFSCRRNQPSTSDVRRFGLKQARMGFRCYRK